MKIFTIISMLLIVVFMSFFYCAPKAALVKQNTNKEQKINKDQLTEQHTITKNTSVKVENNTINLEFSNNEKNNIRNLKKIASPSFFERALIFNDQLQMWIDSVKSIFNQDSQPKNYSAMRC